LKILVAGSFKYEFYDEACARALERLDCSVFRFPWQKYYGSGLIAKIQQRWLIGPGIEELNKNLVNEIIQVNPDVLFVTRGIPIWPKTLQAIKKKDIFLISNNNDDPFGINKSKAIWKYFVKDIPFYDLHYVFRKINVEEYKKCGANNVLVLLPYYVPEVHYPTTLTDEDTEKYSCDIVFIGHAQKDDRLLYLETLSKKGYNFRLYGWHWERLYKHYPWLRDRCYSPVWGLEYTRVIKAAKIALVFYSKANRDTYTTRSFEIPAIGTCMLSEKTEDMTQLFIENKEAVYFSSVDEFVDRVDWLLKDDNARLSIANEALKRVKEIGASIDDRMQQVLQEVKNRTKT
jgi:spore maturation protein CgeB